MKKITLLIVITSLFMLSGCEIVQETKFEPNGSGQYSLGFDLTEMMKMGNDTQTGETQKQLDTLIVFSKFLEAKKDSISKLSKAEQAKLKQLEKYSLYIKADTLSKTFEMKITYKFDNISELKSFGEKLKGQHIKELNVLANSTKEVNKENNIPDFNTYYNTTFNRNKFTVKISREGLAEAAKNKDTAMTKDNPMSDLIRFKSRYIFPYKIKRVDNKNARILPDFKGIEISGNLFELNNDLKYFDVTVAFE